MTSRGFTKEQLYATESYHRAAMPQLGLRDNDLAGWDFSNQAMDRADFGNSNLAGAIFTNAVLTSAVFEGADFSGTAITHANLSGATLAAEQLYQTDDYAQELGCH